MKTQPRWILTVATFCAALSLLTARGQTAPLTNSVSGVVGTSDYIINTQPDPPLTLQRGVTYVFQVRVSSLHPFDTNTTTFDRLDAICGPNVFLRVRNQSN